MNNFDTGELAGCHKRVESLILCRGKLSPANIAAFNEDSSINYAELLYTAYSIAKKLADFGVNAGDNVCLCCERDIPGLAAALGILMAGGVYVPISSEYPDERINMILEDSQAKIIVTDSHRKLPFEQCKKNLVVNRSWLKQLKEQQIEEYMAKISLREFNPQDPAYILYTSGSSGRPKGVVVSHSAFLNTLAWMISEFDLKAGECIPQKTTWSFTDSLWEMFLPLIIGGRVGFITDAQVKNPMVLYKKLNLVNAVITQFVPPAMTIFLDVIEEQVKNPSIPSLRWVLNGGEELPRTLVDRWFNVFPNVGYANPYGMTESAIYATNFSMKEPPIWGMRKIPVGKPIPGAEVYIISDEGELLGNEMIGEICIGGKSLMSGYWNRPELTDKVFIRFPDNNGWLYRTGDYGARRVDGNFSYMGRKDDQIKIRGMRVELQEIRRIMLEHPHVKQAAVISQGKGVQKTISGFYTVYPKKLLSARLLKAYMQSKLPSYMVPSYFIYLPKMPVTEHNKINYKKLEEIPIQRSIQSHKLNDEYGLLERQLHAIWSEVIGHDNFGLDDPFFTAGGNSLLLIKVYAKLPKELQNAIEFSELLDYPTIRKLAKRFGLKHGQKISNEQKSAIERSASRLRTIRMKRILGDNDGL